MPEQTVVQSAAQTLTSMIDGANVFAAGRDQFLVYVLATLCDMASAESGAVLRLEQSDAVQMMAVYPPLEQANVAPPWLGQSADYVPAIIQSGQARIVPLAKTQELYGQSPSDFLIFVPLTHAGAKPEVAVFVVHIGHGSEVVRMRERLELSAALLGVYDMQQTLAERGKGVARMRAAMETVAQVSEHDRFRASAMTLCNEMAARWSAQRVSLGVLSGRYVKVRAISHTDKFTRKMRLVQDLESVMEECLDQDSEVVYPALPEATYVYRAAEQTSTRHGPMALCSVPLRRDGQVKAVLTIEREVDRPFNVDEVETMRLAADLCSGWIISLSQRDRWFGARAATDLRQGAAGVLGPRHTWVKLTVIGLVAAVIFFATFKSTYRVDAPFVIEAPRLQVVSAPFEGRLKAVNVKPDDLIVGGETVMAEFDTYEQSLKLADYEFQLATHDKERDEARNQAKTSEAQIAEAKAAMVQAQIDLLKYYIGLAQIVAPFDGVVLTGDLERKVNGQFEKGAEMFQIAPADSYRAELSVPDNRIGDVLAERDKRRREADEALAALAALTIEELRAKAEAQELAVPADADKQALVNALAPQPQPLRGELATAAQPGVYIPFQVERIDAVAQVVSQRNVFKVHVKLLIGQERIDQLNLRKGMQGVAKIDIDRRNFLAIWTHDVADWIRMKLWI